MGLAGRDWLLVTIQHPMDSVTIGQHAILCAPKGILQGHIYFTTFRQGFKYVGLFVF
jgi:hypothetical protein